MDYRDRNTCVLFGDGAGAAIVEACDDGIGVLSVDLGADGVAGSTMVFETFGSRGELSACRDPERNRLHFEGQAVFKIAVRGITDSVRRALTDAGLTVDDVGVAVPHQANQRIIDAAAKRLGLDPERVVLNIADHGNTSAASVPMALNDALDRGRITPGDVVVLTAFGGGVTWGTVVVRWGDRVTRLATSDAALPAPEIDVFRDDGAGDEQARRRRGRAGRGRSRRSPGCSCRPSRPRRRSPSAWARATTSGVSTSTPS
jgi:3-oxoacyl-[acyl-carrier-protein] synthase III